MLGIDAVQMGLNWRDRGAVGSRRHEKRGPHPIGSGAGNSSLLPAKLVSVLESASTGQGISRRMKEQFNQRRNAQASSSDHPAPSLLDLPSQRKSHSHHHHLYSGSGGHSSRAPDPVSEPFTGTEVRRQKKKLIIQPSQQPSSSHNHYNHH
jgi:hypothetical protein